MITRGIFVPISYWRDEKVIVAVASTQTDTERLTGRGTDERIINQFGRNRHALMAYYSVTVGIWLTMGEEESSAKQA